MIAPAHLSTRPASLTVAMLLADGRLPSGGHAHSAGLEPALLAGMSAEEVPAYLVGRARTTSLVEAGTAVVARHRLRDASSDPGLDEIVDHWAARTPSAAQREASRLLGRGVLRLAARLWPDAEAVRACVELTAPPRPVVVGAIAAVTDMDPRDLVRVFVYEDAQTAAAALLKLAPTDPAVPVGWVLAACTAVEEFVDAVAELTDPAGIPAGSAPHSEGWAEAHALTNRRLFRA
ncbi:urease accessory protein UreF [Microbacterium sp. 22303]|uniref:urease accessory protein UreF n=1 Tax=Microbacterium sp. 22303 TaxID=3453905 RepID=UPI003F82C0AF